jgi:hypothetical protein
VLDLRQGTHCEFESKTKLNVVLWVTLQATLQLMLSDLYISVSNPLIMIVFFMTYSGVLSFLVYNLHSIFCKRNAYLVLVETRHYMNES